MLFNSFEFALFFAIAFVVYLRLPLRGQNLWLLGASYAFYAFWDWRFLSLIWISTAVDYLVARRMEAAAPGTRRRWLWLSLATNLGILATFKYLGFFAESTAALLEALGFHPDVPTLTLILPVGISFYTFQTLGYTIDVYRGRQDAIRDPLLFALYVAFFPQLVAGPIERASRLLPQLARPRTVDANALASGGLLVLIGLVRKVAIADSIGPHVDAVFADPGAMSGAALVLAAFLFGVQIYCDFAGYTDIARGVARMFGIELMENFRQPYFARNPSEFWRRWHISLSTWLRDYLYIPLGGSRVARWAVYRNLMATMLLGGLWHGAAWTFVIWGAIHGVALAVHRALFRERVPAGERTPLARRSVAFAGWLATFVIVTCAWIFFRAPDLASAAEFVVRIAGWEGGLLPKDLLAIVWLVPLLLFLDLPQQRQGSQLAMLRWPWPLRGLSYAALVLTLVLLGAHEQTPFLYFQF